MRRDESPAQECLETYVLCPRCDTLHQRVSLPDGHYARCTRCRAVLYRSDSRLIQRALAWALTGVILFVTANLFPLVRIDFLGKEQYVTTLVAIRQLVQSGYDLVGMGVLFLTVVIPALVLADFTGLLLLMYLRRGKTYVRRLLILLAYLLPWSMADIFLISILVALVKLSDDVDIWFGVSFWAMILYVGVDLYLTKIRRQGDLWEHYRKVYHANG